MAGRLITEDFSLLLNILVDNVSVMLEYSIPGSRFSTLKLLNLTTLEENQLFVDREGNAKNLLNTYSLPGTVLITLYAYLI